MLFHDILYVCSLLQDEGDGIIATNIPAVMETAGENVEVKARSRGADTYQSMMVMEWSIHCGWGKPVANLGEYEIRCAFGTGFVFCLNP